MKYDLLLSADKDNRIINRYVLSGDKKTLQYLTNINNINIFVGANNSGKSWMMRYLMGLAVYDFCEFDELLSLINQFNQLLKKDIVAVQNQNIWMPSIEAPNIIIRRIIDFS